MTVPYSFGTATSAIPLSQLDSNFNTPITLGNTAIQLGNTVTTLNNMTLANVTISSGSITIPYGNANAVVYTNSSNVATTSTALTFDGTYLNLNYVGQKLTDGYGLFWGSGTSTYLSASGASNYIAFTTSSSEQMRLTSTGLGIGTSSPSGKLHTYETNGVNYFESPGISSIALQFKTNNSNRYRIGIPSASADLAFYAGGTTETMRLDSSGNLLVGSTTANAKGYIYQGTSGADTFWAENGAGNNVCRLKAASGSQNYLDIWAGASAGVLNFRPGGTTAMTLDASGNLSVGNTATAGGRIDVTAASSATAINIRARSGNDYGFIQFKSNDGATTWGEVYTTSAIRLYCDAGGTNGVYLTSGATSWTANSDERLKENLVPIENGLSKVCSLRSVIGNFIADENKTKKPFLIAQDVQAVLPEAVSSGAMPKSDDPTEYLGVAYTDVIPLLVAAIKEQQDLITQLQADVASLKGAK